MFAELQATLHHTPSQAAAAATTGMTVIVAHASPLVREGVVSTLRRLQRCPVQTWDNGALQMPLAGEGRRVYIADFQRVEQILHRQEDMACRPAARIVLLGTERQLDDAAMAMPRDVHRLSVDCGEQDLLAAVGEPAGSGSRHVPGAARGGLAPFVQRRVCDYIDRHLAERLALSDLAEVAGLSSCHFARAFKHSMGVSPLRFLSRCRVERAATLLDYTQRGLCEIAQEVGFWDQSHFSHAFRDVHGMTPGAYRRRVR